MNERIKKLRKELKLTQISFGEKIGIKGNTVTNYENGLRNPSDAVIKSICREFNVNEKWLRTGEGDMFIQLDDDDELFQWIGEVLKDKPEYQYRIFNILKKMSEEELKTFAKFGYFLIGEEEPKDEE